MTRPAPLRTVSATYPLRLPLSIKSEAERLAAADGSSLNQFIATAVAEKVAAMRTIAYFAERGAGANAARFERLLTRAGGEPPRDDDIVPDDLRARLNRRFPPLA